MAVKPTLFWTLIRDWHVGGFKIMRVTTEKTTKLCGTCGEAALCIAANRTVGRFKTEIEAQNRIDDVAGVRRRFAPLLKTARDRLKDLERQELEEIEKSVRRGENRYLLEAVK